MAQSKVERRLLTSRGNLQNMPAFRKAVRKDHLGDPMDHHACEGSQLFRKICSRRTRHSRLVKIERTYFYFLILKIGKITGTVKEKERKKKGKKKGKKKEGRESMFSRKGDTSKGTNMPRSDNWEHTFTHPSNMDGQRSWGQGFSS